MPVDELLPDSRATFQNRLPFPTCIGEPAAPATIRPTPKNHFIAEKHLSPGIVEAVNHRRQHENEKPTMQRLAGAVHPANQFFESYIGSLSRSQIGPH